MLGGDHMVTARELLELPPELERAVNALDPSASLVVRLDAIEEIARWVINPGGFARLRAPAPLQLSRIKHLIQVLEDHPDVASTLAKTLESVFWESKSVALFAESGMPGDRGLLGETFERIAQRILPRPPDDEDLDRFVSRLFRARRDCAWITEAPVEVFQKLGELLGNIWQPIFDGMKDAIALLCTRISALGLSAPLRERSDAMLVRDNPFFRLPLVSLEEMPMVIAECRSQLDVIRRNLESSGVSVDVVYRVDSIERMLRRTARLLTVLDEQKASNRAAEVQKMLGVLTLGRIEDQSIRQLGKENLGIVARKMIERVGGTEELRVAATKKDYAKMLVSAAGGGAIAALAVMGRFFVAWGQFAPFIDGMFTGCVYAGSFVIMQLIGMTFALKQSSMTGATLAASLRETNGKRDIDHVVATIAKLSRTQFAAVVGNIVAIAALAIGIDLLWNLATGDHFLDTKTTAPAVIGSLSVGKIGTFTFAAITGVLMFLSGLASGWLENWMLYRRIPEAIRKHRSIAGRVAGKKSLDRIATFLERHVAGLGNAIVLGFLLALTPIFFKLFGIPMDVRHVTLAAGRLVFAGCAAGFSHVTVTAIIGIVVIGLINFAVSFALALWVALRARDVENKDRLTLLSALAKRFVRHPVEFFWPTKASQPEPEPLPVAQVE
ncbi:MAG: hypothetical protein QM831_32325 [Kofleriaceae bacterium]